MHAQPSAPCLSPFGIHQPLDPTALRDGETLGKAVLSPGTAEGNSVETTADTAATQVPLRHNVALVDIQFNLCCLSWESSQWQTPCGFLQPTLGIYPKRRLMPLDQRFSSGTCLRSVSPQPVISVSEPGHRLGRHFFRIPSSCISRASLFLDPSAFSDIRVF